MLMAYVNVFGGPCCTHGPQPCRAYRCAYQRLKPLQSKTCWDRCVPMPRGVAVYDGPARVIAYPPRSKRRESRLVVSTVRGYEGFPGIDGTGASRYALHQAGEGKSIATG